MGTNLSSAVRHTPQSAAAAVGIINLELTTGDKLKPCPFCGSVVLELQNTWRASYWIECQGCEVEMHGDAFEPRKGRATLVHHKRAKASAIKAWNRRDGVSS